MSVGWDKAYMFQVSIFYQKRRIKYVSQVSIYMFDVPFAKVRISKAVYSGFL